MIRIQQGQGEGSGLNTTKINGGKAEPSAAYRRQHLRADWISHRPRQVLRRQLDPRYLIMVPDPQIGESQLPQGGFGAFDLAQLGRRNGVVVRNPRRQARRGRLVGHRQIQSPSNGTYITFGHAGLDEWPQHIVVGGSPGAWSVGSSRIVGVLSVRDGVKVVAVGDLVLDPAEQLVLAVKTAIRPVRLILGAIAFMRLNFDEWYAQLGRNMMCRAALVEGEAGGDAKQSNDPVSAERPRRKCQ
jgi:hypothetical protein